jgi:Antibiotic biosynthesis monooxygenase
VWAINSGRAAVGCPARGKNKCGTPHLIARTIQARKRSQTPPSRGPRDLPDRSPTNPLKFFIFELYVDEAAWGAHEATDHFKTAVVQLLPMVTRRERVPFIPFLAN